MNAIERFAAIAAIAAIAAGLAPAAQAAYTIPKFRVNQYYDSNAVLQRGVTLPISGAAIQGRTVTVTFAGRTLSTTADLDSPYASDGEARWRVEFPAMEAGGPYTLTATDGTTTLTATNILVGEVWLASGQSNAYYPIERFADSAAWLQDADYPTIRFIEATENHFEWQLNQNAWQVASSATTGKCSAMGFFFAKELQGKLGVPVGIVTAAVDGSLIDEWLPGCTSAKDHYTKMILNSLEPVPPLPVRGVLWYQGESDGMFGFGYNYRFKLQSLVRNWRALWNDADMPFLVAQLPFFGAYGQWCDVRDSQNWVGRQEQGVHVVPTLDIGDLADIHPPKKPELGRRLSEFARKYVYGESGLYPEGPVYLRSEANPDNASEILVHFDAHTAITSGDGQALRGFQVGGDYYGTTKFFDGTVRIVDADTLAVSCPTFPEPLAVRYGFANTDPVNFFDAEGNAAGAFRTDSFKLQSQSEDVHEHGWRLTASGDTLTATCTNANCTAGTPTFSIGGETAKAYDGTPLAATLVGTDFAALTSSSLGMLEYYRGSTKLPGPPVEPGTYEARVEVDHQNTIYVLRRTLTITAPRPRVVFCID